MKNHKIKVPQKNSLLPLVFLMAVTFALFVTGGLAWVGVVTWMVALTLASLAAVAAVAAVRPVWWFAWQQVALDARKDVAKQKNIQPAPGSLWMRFTEFFYSKKFVEGTIKPTIADWHCEYFEALQEKREWKARWINVRYHWAMIKTLGLGKVWELVEKVFGLVKSKS